jgi:hypothetical protein
LANTEKFTVPDPVPALPDEIITHGLPEVAVHPQPLAVVTPIELELPPAAETES